MRKLVIGAAALLGLAALTAPQGASAQGFSVTADFGGYDAPRVVEEYRAPRDEWRHPHWRRDGYGHHHHRVDRYGYGRPVGFVPGHREPGCVVRVNRYFDGYATVTEKRRICR